MASHVHIVNHDDKHIIPRMARWLSNGLGWSIGREPDPAASVNYFMPYTVFGAIRQQPSNAKMTGWFTHWESANRGKVAIWNSAARIFDQRLITSPVYEPALSDYGLTTRILPGIDLDAFSVGKGRKRKGYIGLSGIVTGPRKGNEWAWPLLNKYDDKLLVAGSGWGVPSQLIPYEEMNDFYNRLDVYICTSTEEGIPAPVLEAMACGCKVVMPTNVGISELLIDAPGVHHYQCGDYEAMTTAVKSALADNTPRATIREAVTVYGIDAWVESHRAAIKQLEEYHGLSD